MSRLNNGSFGGQKTGRGSGRKLGKCGNGNRFRNFLGMQSASAGTADAQDREPGQCRRLGRRIRAGLSEATFDQKGTQTQASVNWINSAIEDLQHQINDLRQKLDK